tara:strand:+ start:3607 stop:3975 length:369 start_codon:yes stop_codon:yes gene_type:complete
MEYKVISTRSDSDLSEKLNVLAEEGWRFLSLSATAIPPHVVMKVAIVERCEADKEDAAYELFLQEQEKADADFAEYEEQQRKDAEMAYWFDKQVQQDHIDFVDNMDKHTRAYRKLDNGDQMH